MIHWTILQVQVLARFAFLPLSLLHLLVDLVLIYKKKRYGGDGDEREIIQGLYARVARKEEMCHLHASMRVSWWDIVKPFHVQQRRNE